MLAIRVSASIRMMRWGFITVVVVIFRCLSLSCEPRCGCGVRRYECQPEEYEAALMMSMRHSRHGVTCPA